MKDYLNSATFKRSWRISLVLVILLAIFWLIFKKVSGNVPSYNEIGFAMVLFNKPIIETNFAISQWFTLPALPLYIFLACLFYYPKNEEDLLAHTIMFVFSIMGLANTLIFGVLTGLASLLIMTAVTGLVVLLIMIFRALGPIFIDWISGNECEEEDVVEPKDENSFTPGRTSTHVYGASRNTSRFKGWG